MISISHQILFGGSITKDQMHVACGTYRGRRKMHIWFFFLWEENQKGHLEDQEVDMTTLN